jgi:hypothetical protein
MIFVAGQGCRPEKKPLAAAGMVRLVVLPPAKL